VFGYFSFNTDVSACGLTGGENALITYCNPTPSTDPEWIAGLTTGELTSVLTSSDLDFNPYLNLYASREYEVGSVIIPKDYDYLSYTAFGGGEEIEIFLEGPSDIWERYSGSIPIIPTELNLSDFDTRELFYQNDSMSFTAEIGSLRIVPTIPEPTAALLFGAGIALVGSATRRRTN
jgi:hypothetical protein